MTDSTAQDFWLDCLGDAGRFNRWVFSRFARHLGPTVLEIGCGSGSFTLLMAAHGCRVTGIDLHAPYVDTARRRLAAYPTAQVACADATRADWVERFHSVVLLDVLEHLEDDVGFLDKLRGWLRPGGRLILKVPAGRWLLGPMDRAIGHWRRYDPASLRATLAAAGFELVEHSHFNVFGMLGWWFNGKLLKRVTPPGEQLALFERLVPWFRAVEGDGRLPFGLSLIAIAAVPAVAPRLRAPPEPTVEEAMLLGTALA